MSMNECKGSSFDEIFKSQLKENEDLKLRVKDKTEEIYSLKTLI